MAHWRRFFAQPRSAEDSHQVCVRTSQLQTLPRLMDVSGIHHSLPTLGFDILAATNGAQSGFVMIFFIGNDTTLPCVVPRMASMGLPSSFSCKRNSPIPPGPEYGVNGSQSLEPAPHTENKQ